MDVCLPFFMLNAYILSVHSSSGFYEELHQVVVTLPSRQVKRLKLGDWRFVRDLLSSRGLNLVVGWTFPSFELFLGKALFEQIFWNIKLFQIFETLLYNTLQYFRILSCSWANNWVYKYPQVAPECVRGEVLSTRRGFRLLSLRTAGCCPPKIREEGIDGVGPKTI